jgi:hypothetical protein
MRITAPEQIGSRRNDIHLLLASRGRLQVRAREVDARERAAEPNRPNKQRPVARSIAGNRRVQFRGAPGLPQRRQDCPTGDSGAPWAPDQTPTPLLVRLWLQIVNATTNIR